VSSNRNVDKTFEMFSEEYVTGRTNKKINTG
jgi:hypothetical protein